jgi:hypothetical protein
MILFRLRRFPGQAEWERGGSGTAVFTNPLGDMGENVQLKVRGARAILPCKFCQV